MIISDKYQFAFVHIPKNGGTSIKRAFSVYSDAWQYSDTPSNLHEIERVYYQHIPLFILRRYFPDAYDKVKKYKSFAIVRDPHARFYSAFAQHLRTHSPHRLELMKPDFVRDSVHQVINVLKNHQAKQSFLPYEYIFFQRQVDFTHDEGNHLVKNLYVLDDIESMLSDMANVIGHDFAAVKDPHLPDANKTLYYRKNIFLRLFINILRMFAKPFMTHTRWDRLKNSLATGGEASMELREVFETDQVREFISDYYSEDLLLYKRLLQDRAHAGQ